MKHIHLETVTSTNQEILKYVDEAPVYLTADNQTAGRGQRGNTWESEPGKNITMSILLRLKHVRPAEQFAVSRAVAIAVCDILTPLLPFDKSALIKWPNDIYIDDKKIAGILIENSISGTELKHTVIGIGLNVNQMEFLSPAPNPVSLAQILGHTLDAGAIAAGIADRVLKLVGGIDGATAFSFEYHRRLWQIGVMRPFHDTATGEIFTAAIDHVEDDGRLALKDAAGHLRHYYFKEVAFL
ncbi:MAG: biotin--[acetyl-CoA-carboxylase] ligase [Muribaculaceae bacterium]|nr:biotin--[acetyl-CoA-carboxylase] ligase [Muribaculaceae bacterium]